MAVRTATGTTLPGNLTIVPSEQKWVFHSIYSLAFRYLYSDEVCSRNRLLLTDEDDAEYRSFEALIDTSRIFAKSKVMLCSFHAIWLPFKKDLLPKLDSCVHGKVYGEWLYKLFMHQSCVFENQEQYRKSHLILTKVVQDAFEKGVIDQVLKDIIEAFQTKIATKEIYLAHWVRKERQNCYDAMTTSPVESINSHIKHCTKASTLNNTSRSLIMITTGKWLYSVFLDIHTN